MAIRRRRLTILAIGLVIVASTIGAAYGLTTLLTGPAGAVVQLSAGGGHVCAIDKEYTLRCWGNNNLGQTEVPSGQYQEVSAGSNHTCALNLQSEIRCWGYNFNNQLAAPKGAFQAIAAGADHSCAIRDTGQVVCWGAMDPDDPAYARRFGPLIEAPVGSYQAIDAGYWHTCALEQHGSVSCWDSQGVGQIDPGTTAFKTIAAGRRTTCALREDGSATCWHADLEPDDVKGRFRVIDVGWDTACAIDDASQLLCWEPDWYDPPRPVAYEGEYIAVSVGINFTCAITRHHKVRCWGDDDYGQEEVVPGQYRSISAGGHFTCAVDEGGEIKCWGGPEPSEAPVVRDESWDDGPFTVVSAGGDRACALTEDQQAVCWSRQPTYRPARESGPPQERFQQLDSSWYDTCGVTVTGDLYCWGKGYEGTAWSPMENGPWQAVAIGSSYYVDTDEEYAPPEEPPTDRCALRPNGQIHCWDYPDGSEPAPGTYKAISMAPLFSCAIDLQDQARCRTLDYYKRVLGWGDPPNDSYESVDAFGDSYCALSVDGEVICYTAHTAGYRVSCEPVGEYGGRKCDHVHGHWTTAPGSSYMSISAGADHACAIKEDGTADCWLLYPKPTRPPEAIAATVSDRRPPVKWLRDDSPDCSNRNADQPSSRQGRITGLWLEDEWIDIGFLPKCGKLIPMASITTERLPVLGSSLKTWWRSGIVSVGGEPWGWIGVRLLPDGTIEVSFQRLNGKRIYPQMRYMSPSEHGEDWWSSSRFDAGIAAPEQQ